MTLLLDKQGSFLKAFIIAAVILMASIAVCSTADTNKTGSSIEKVEVYHFHPTKGCYTCTTMGQFAEDTVKQFFPNELETKKIVFDHINFQDLKNTELEKQYEFQDYSHQDRSFSFFTLIVEHVMMPRRF